MPIDKERPQKVREVEVTVPGDDGQRTVRGANLDDVLRQVIWDLADAGGWSVAETARRIGVPQPTLHDFLDPAKQRGLRLETLSRACAALRVSPVDLFRRHERYRPENKGDAPFAEDLIFDRFRALLSPAMARRLVRVIEAMIDRGALASQLETWEKSLGIVKPEAPKERKPAGSNEI